MEKHRDEPARAREIVRAGFRSQNGSSKLPERERNRRKVVAPGEDDGGGVPTGSAAHPAVYDVRNVIIIRREARNALLDREHSQTLAVVKEVQYITSFLVHY